MADERKEVVVTNIRMPFWSMVVFLIKLALAAIPALLILWILTTLVMAVLGVLFWVPWLPEWRWFYWGPPGSHV